MSLLNRWRSVLTLILGALSLSAAEPAPKCVFCEIAAGSRDAAVDYRNELVLAFLTIEPRNPGHVLVIPIRHADNLLDVPPATAAEMMVVGHRVASAIRRTSLAAEGFNFRVNSGAAAGQTVFHAHLHVIPRFKGEAPESERYARVDNAELQEIAQRIRERLETLDRP